MIDRLCTLTFPFFKYCTHNPYPHYTPHYSFTRTPLKHFRIAQKIQSKQEDHWNRES